jgi:uncharacterized phage protein (predicted DNA packaging)
MLDKVKQALRISNTTFDTELNDLIDAAKADLVLSGILQSRISAIDTDILIQRAVMVYCKCYFGIENPEYERNLQAYNSLKNHLSLTAEYMEVGE